MALSVKQKRELSDKIGEMLLSELQTKTVKDRVCSLICDYLDKNKLKADPSELFKTVEWHVKVLLKG